MSDLYPTKTRLMLLRDVAGIHREGDGRSYVHWGDDCYCRGGRITRKVTAAMDEMERAGWIAPESPRGWHLTDAGRAVLDGAS